jgi:orotate phosphoribosyltransferase
MVRIALIDLMKKLGLAKYQPNSPFTLSSGKKSPYYFDVKGALLHGATSQLIFSVLSKMMFQLKPHFIGGPANGAYLLAVQAVTPYAAGRGFVMRKERKEHGLGVDVDGWAPKKGHPTVIVEDVITTGKSLLPTIDFIKSLEAELIAIIPVIDRNEDDVLGEHRKLVKPILRASDFTWDDDEASGKSVVVER